MAGPADAASLRLASPSEPSRFERPMQVGQAARTCLLRERESDNGPFRRRRLLRSTRVETRCGDAMPSEGSHPPGSSGARRRNSLGSGRPSRGPLDSGPEGRWFTPLSYPPREDRLLHYRGRISVERPGAHGFAPGSDSIAVDCAACPYSIRGSTPPALFRTKPKGASGQSRWQQRPCLRTRQRSKASGPAERQRSRRTQLATVSPASRSDLNRRGGIAHR